MTDKPFGRPREYNREKIFEDLIEWARKDDSLNINKFCCTQDPPFGVRRLSEWARGNHDFLLSYETAKAFLACRREEKLSTQELHVKAYDLTASVYDLSLKDEIEDTAKFNSNLKIKEQKVATDDDVKRYENWMEYIKDVKKSHSESALNKDEIKDKTDIKS